MDDIQERLEHYEGKDRERKEREAEIMRIDLQLFVYARNHATPDDVYCRMYMQRNAMILDYGKTYGTKAQERLREMLDEARTKLVARMHEFEEEAGTDKMTESDYKKNYEDYRAEIERLNKLIERLNKLIEVKDEISEIKDKQISEYKKIIEVQEKQIYMQEQHILNLKYLLNAGK